jgi:hypothetical protein
MSGSHRRQSSFDGLVALLCNDVKVEMSFPELCTGRCV